MLALLFALSIPFTLDGGDVERIQAAPPPAGGSPSGTTTPTPPPPPSPADDPDGLMKHLSIGASVSNAQSTTATKPYVDVEANFPVLPTAPGGTFPRVRIDLEAQLAAVASQSTSQVATSFAAGDLSGFYSVSFQGRLDWVIGSTSVARTTVGFGAGVSSVLASGPNQPTTANPGHAELSFSIAKKDHSASFVVSPIGVSKEVGDPATVGRVDGRVTLGGSVPLRFQVSVIYPYGNAPSNWYAVGTTHNVLTTVAVSYDFDKVIQKASTGAGTGQSYAPWKHAPPTIDAGRSGGAGAEAGF